MKPTRRDVLIPLTAAPWLAARPAWAQAPGAANRVMQVESAAAPRLDKWRILGPGGGGAMFLPVVSPHNPKLIMVTTDMSGVFLSKDGGDTWRSIHLRTKAFFTAFHPVDPQRLFISNRLGLYESRDQGVTWSLFYPDPGQVRGIQYSDFPPSESLALAKGAASGVAAMAFEPRDAETIYILDGRVLSLTRNGGRSWQPLATLPARASTIYLDPRSPQDNRTLLMLGQGASLLALFEGGKLRIPPPGKPIAWVTGSACLFPEGDGPPAIFVAADYLKDEKGQPFGGLIVSRDLGQSWSMGLGHLLAERPRPDIWPTVSAVAAGPAGSNLVYVSFTRMSLASGDPRAVYLGVGKSTDGGNSWKLVWKENNQQQAPNVEDPWITERYGAEWGENPLSMTIAPHSSEMILGSDFGRVMRSLDGGRNWKGVYSKRQKDGSFTTTGLDVTACSSVHFDPFDKQRIFISCFDIGLMMSENGGGSWRSPTKNGVPQVWWNTAYWVEFDPAVRGRLWMAASRNHELPQLNAFRRGTDGFRGGVVRSDDGGWTWRVTSGGLPQTAVTHLLMDPKSQPGRRTLFLTSFGKGVYRSTDNGESWTAVNQGLPQGEIRAWRLAMDKQGTLYVVLFRRANDEKTGTDADGMLFRSTDQGANWQRVALPEGFNGPTGIAIAPNDPNRIYLSAWGRGKPYDFRKSDGGVWTSSDGGKTWRNVLSKCQHVYSVTLDETKPEVVYAASYEASVWRSADGGANWARVRGFNFRAANRVIPDPHHPGMVYVTTSGSSVWYGPAEGDPAAVEDLVKPAVLRFSL
ncbi:MAG: hypothetical protein J0H49_29150 [Acidobacteria bacterium]|nr:hypothetical protein [Acidobacteriota bacterium]